MNPQSFTNQKPSSIILYNKQLTESISRVNVINCPHRMDIIYVDLMTEEILSSL